MNGPAVRFRALPYLLAFFTSLCIMILELVASRLVARHVGASLNVWTSVIGIMLGGICLGNVLGGRLADRAEPSRVVGPLYALGAALTLGCLWFNALGGMIPEAGMPAWLRTVLVVSIDFLIPGTILGMIGPVVAKIAVEQATRTGSAIGDVYTLGAVGSIAGTFLAGYILMYLAPTTTIVTLVAAALALISALLIGNRFGLVVGLLTSLALGLGSMPSVVRLVPTPGVMVGGTTINPVALTGHALALVLALIGIVRLFQAKLPPEPAQAHPLADEPGPAGSIKLTDLAALSFVISLAFMGFEMAAGRLVSRHLGSSIYGWTSIIGVLLGGLSLGNFLGGKLGDRFKTVSQSSWLFVMASLLILLVLLLEAPPGWLVSNPIGAYFRDKPREPLIPGNSSILSMAVEMDSYTWGVRVFWVVFLAFFLPSVALGTVSPVMAKLAIDRVRMTKRTGGAIGSVYAWGMVGSILGTFLTGFLLIDLLGAKGVLLAIATILALAATVIGTTWHAVWAGIPLGLCIIMFVPLPILRAQGEKWGIREPVGNPDTEKDNAIAYIDESNYYYIKVENESDRDGQKRTLVLDNLIHGYFILGHPERLDYDYEHLYAMVSDRVARAKAKAKGLEASKPAPLETLFLGGGAYAFQRYILNKYPGSTADVAEIDPAVLKANKTALGLPQDTPITTHLGDARQYVERNAGGDKRFDIVFGDAFNDFSVPWHLTTREFNDKLAAMMTPDGVYMINIIDKYISDRHADELADQAVKKSTDAGNPISPERAKQVEHAKALTFGGFLGSWIKTARLTFPHIYVFGTDNNPGNGMRETFVVVASKTPLDLEALGAREADPQFLENDQPFEARVYGPQLMDELEVRSRGIILTDDYAPVENLLAPVARTRGSNED